MIIEYQIKRSDLVKAYFYNLGHSRITQLIVFGASVFVIGYNLFFRYRAQSTFTLPDILISFLSGLVFIILIPGFLFLTAKSQKRILSIGPHGIETKIGTKSGSIAWNEIASIAVEKDTVLITGRNANAFTIPARAISNAEVHRQFIEMTAQYRAQSESSAGN